MTHVQVTSTQMTLTQRTPTLMTPTHQTPTLRTPTQNAPSERTPVTQSTIHTANSECDQCLRMTPRNDGTEFCFAIISGLLEQMGI